MVRINKDICGLFCRRFAITRKTVVITRGQGGKVPPGVVSNKGLFVKIHALKRTAFTSEIWGTFSNVGPFHFP